MNKLKKILIGDDNSMNLNALARSLRLRKLEVDLANTPDEVIAKAKAGDYSAVITDLNYTSQGKEGYEVLRAIKDLPTKKILYTGRMGFEYAAEGFAEGADYVVLRKDAEQLMQVLDELKIGDRK